MTEEEKKDVASCISSILTSTTRRMTVGFLCTDFRNTVGYDIPFRKFGCDSIDNFLRTLSDKVQVFGSGPSAEVQVVINEKTAHINELISKQRVSKPKFPRRINQYSANRFPARRKFHNYSLNNFNTPSCSYESQNRSIPSLFDSLIAPPQRSCELQKSPQAWSHETRREPPARSCEPQKSPQACSYEPRKEPSARSSEPQKSPQPYSYEPRKEPPPCSYESRKPYIDTFQEQAVTAQTGYRGSSLLKSSVVDTISEPSDLFFSDDEEAIITNTKIPQIVQDNLRKLIMKYPDGIWCSNLLEFYKKDYAKLLNYNEYGYRSIAQMCADLGNIFSVVQLEHNGVKLFAKDKPIPQDTVNIITKLELIKMKATAERPTQNAVPEREIEQFMGDIYTEKVPPDVVEFGTRIEQQWIDPGTNEQDYIDVNIGEVYDPSKFWMNLKQYGIQLNTLMDNMQMFYDQRKDALAVPFLALRKNLYIACIFSNEYHRARIVDTSQRNEHVVKAYFIDYGTVSVISIETICYLHKQFAELPEQAIRGRLGGIYPTNENEQWSRSAASRFLGFVMQKDLVAQIIHIDEERKILDIVLADTSVADEDFFINDALVHLGFAVFTFQERPPAEPTGVIPIVRYIHLFPTFDELENGLVPNALQMIAMHQAGLCIEQIYPHYFKDTTTGQPISISRIPVNRTPEALEHSYQTIDSADDDVTAGISNDRGNLSWSDSIEKKREEDEILEEEDNYDDEVEVVSTGLNNISVETDDLELITKNSEKPEETNETNTNNEMIKTNVSVDTNNTNVIPIINKPLRPPPGYNITPQNVTINYNCHGPSNYLTNQTCINAPAPMSNQTPPIGFGDYHVDPMVQQRNYICYLNSLLMRGFMTQNAYPMYPQSYAPIVSNYAPMPPNYSLPYPDYPINNVINPNYWPPQQQYNNSLPTMPVPTNMPNTASSFNPSTISTSKIQPTAKEFIPRSHIMPNNESESSGDCDEITSKIQSNNNINKSSSVELPISSDNESIIRNINHSRNNDINEPDDLNENHTKDVELDAEFSEVKIGENTKLIDRKNAVPACWEQLARGESSNEAEEEIISEYESDEIDTAAIRNLNSRNNEVFMSDIDESDYETCLSSDGKSNFIRKIGSDDLNLHLIKYDGDFYFLLTELSNKLFGKSLTVVQIRRLSVGVPHIISVVDIRLKTNLELKTELLTYELISENDLSVDAIPIKYLTDLTTIIPCDASIRIIRMENLLKEVELFYKRECET